MEGATSLLTTVLPNPNPSAFPQDLANIPNLGYARAGQKGAGGRAGLGWGCDRGSPAPRGAVATRQVCGPAGKPRRQVRVRIRTIRAQGWTQAELQGASSKHQRSGSGLSAGPTAEEAPEEVFHGPFSQLGCFLRSRIPGYVAAPDQGRP